MEELPSGKNDEFSKFLNDPPIWFALCLWLYPLFYTLFCALVSPALGGSESLGYMLFFIFFGSLIFLFSASRWFRRWVAFMAPFWLFFLMATMGMTQGAITSAFAKAFSEMTSQLNSLEKVKASEQEHAPNQLDKSSSER